MRELFSTIFNLIKACLKLTFILAVSFLFAGIATAGIDYLQMKNNNLPVFNVAYYDAEKNTQTFRGIFYTASRKIRASLDEPLEDSTKVEYKLISRRYKITYQNAEEKPDFYIETKEISDCQEKAKLYYANLKIKVYTYCLEDIEVSDHSKKDTLYNYLAKDESVLEDIDANLGYKGVLSDMTTAEFISLEDTFTNQGLKMYRCNKKNINDVYIGPQNMSFHTDFCTFKDDDFKFIYELKDETPDSLQPVLDASGNTVPEVFYEDATNRYEFELPKSKFVSIITPAVRGKAATERNIKMALTSKLVTIEELKEKGLQFQTIDKEKERLEKEQQENTPNS